MAYEESDKRKPWVPCPDCGEFQTLIWAQVHWDSELPREDQPASARYVCCHCGSQWDDIKRIDATTRVVWVAEKSFRGVAGFCISHLYSPYKTLAGLAGEWLAITADKSDKASERLRKFINTNLAEEYVEKGEAPEWERLYERSRNGHKQGVVPCGGLFLTAGADVQKDRIEVSIYVWGREKRSWCIDHVVFAGDTSRPEVWAELSGFLNQTYRHEVGVDMPIARFAIDSGYATQDVYAWARHQGSKVIVVKGQDHGPLLGLPKAQDISYAGKKIQRGIKVWPVNVSEAKLEFYRWLALQRPTDEAFAAGVDYPPGYCHFAPFGEEFFQQLTAEQLVTKIVKGRTRQEWIKTGRNEALDDRNYNRAAAEQIGISRFNEQHWQQLEEGIRARIPAPPTSPVEVPVLRAEVSAPQQQISAPAPRPIARPPLSRVLGRFRI